MYGDVNNDNKWDITDIAIIGSHIMGRIELTGNALEAADINGDSKADIVDIAFIGSYITGRINTIPQRNPQ